MRSIYSPSDVPQTEAQTALLENGTVPAKTCFMSDKNKEDLWTNLRAHGGEFTRNDLNDLVSWAEGERDVEYAIILVDKNGNPDKRSVLRVNQKQRFIMRLYRMEFQRMQNMMKYTHRHLPQAHQNII